MSLIAALFILLAFSAPARGQFEFNDNEAVYNTVVQALRQVRLKCAVILRPTEEDAQQTSAINWLMKTIAKHEKFIATIQSYTLQQYEKIYMDVNYRNSDNCVYWLAIVMASNSTNKQLIHLSNTHFFEQPFWVVFANRSETSGLFNGVRMTMNCKIWTVESYGEDHLILQSPVQGVPSFIVTRSGTIIQRRATNDHAALINHTLRVGTIEFDPYVNVIRNKSGHITNVTGFYGDLWTDLESRLQFKTVYYEPADKIFGSYDDSGKWTGLYGMLVANDIDVILGDMTMALSRYEVVDFSHPVERVTYKIYYKRNADIFDFFKAFRPLSRPIWLALFLWITIGGLAAYVAIQTETKFLQLRRKISMISCVYFLLRALTNQGSEQVPKLWALRIFFLTAYLLAAVILPSYSASLISVLTLKTPVEPFRQLTDILSTDYQLSLVTNTTDSDYFEKSSDPIFRKIYHKSVIKNSVVTFSYPSAIQHTCDNPKVVFFGTIAEIIAGYRQSKPTCTLIPLRSDISPVYKTISFAKHSQYRNLIKLYQIQMLQFGLTSRYKRFYTRLENKRTDEDTAISIRDVGGVFILLGFLQCVALTIFCFEHLWKRHTTAPHPYQYTD